ncbi:Hypothetical_protein [Hexamita inflata]|uniref:Hypothetical_protein n=1 Tax=Hexamita inflata TaxID=28002 RepID=A0AA86QGW0_9EUKA|nr:Hypothetical protein HINF_LOCUS42098 [Hexamita inflata]CAI9954462.1 Hypothetical protein HINF_LOCUS42107 [Hexamita inflata]
MQKQTKYAITVPSLLKPIWNSSVVREHSRGSVKFFEDFHEYMGEANFSASSIDSPQAKVPVDQIKLKMLRNRLHLQVFDLDGVEKKIGKFASFVKKIEDNIGIMSRNNVALTNAWK